MLRPGRIFVEGGVYHVHNRVGRGARVVSIASRRPKPSSSCCDGMGAICVPRTHFHTC
jgi:hypothetical protein